MPDNNSELNQLRQRLEALEGDFYRNNFTTSRDETKYVRFNNRMRIPVVSALPATCQQGEKCLVSGTGKEYVCSATDTWTIVGTQS